MSVEFVNDRPLVMHVIPGDLWAGAEAQVYYTLLQLKSAADCRVSIVLFNKTELHSRLEKEGICIHYLDENVNNGLKLCLWIKKLLQQEQPEVVHVHGYKSHILVSIAKYLSGMRFAIIRTIHGELVPPSIRSGLKSYPLMKLEDVLLARYTRFSIAVSESIEQYMLKRYCHAGIKHIRNAVDLPKLSQATSHITRERYDIPVDTLWVATAVRLVEIKNINMLVRVARRLKDAGVLDIKISIFGDGPLRDSLQQMIDQQDLSDVLFMHGHINGMSAVFQELDIFVLTSFSEGLPMSLLEAMSFGVVPVCTAVGGINEVLTDECGYRVDSDNDKQMADAIVELRASPEKYKKASTMARARVEQNYSIENMVKELLPLYHEVLGA